VARARQNYSAGERAEMWARWKRGEAVSEIARALDRAPGTIHCTLRERGGVAPPARKRSPRHLSLPEREEISRSVAAGDSGHAIAARLGRDPSTICREIKRNGGRERYRAADADRSAWERARRPQTCKLARCPELAREVAEKLEADWSPEQIAGHLKRAYPEAEDRQISHETIYLTLFIQARGALRRELIKHLRRSKSLRRPRAAKRKNSGQGQIKDGVSIRERPAEAEDRAVPGHWEGDLIEGRRNTHVATLVERQSRFLMVVAVPGKDTVSVTGALAAQVKTLPEQLRRSLTWDRGMEMAKHAEFTVATDVGVYFCDPQSPWQRGSNENTNGLLRQYLPKGTDLSALSQDELDAIALKLNTRPRKTLEYRTPAEALDGALTPS
jgi:IS30 family transposase